MDCQHANLPCPSLSPGVWSNSAPLSQWCQPTISSSDTLFPFCPKSCIRDFSNELAVPIKWPKYWSFNFSISPSNEYSGLISYRIDLFDHFAVQGTLKSLLQNHSPKASIFWCSAFFMIQLSHPYMTAGKTTALTRWTFVGWALNAGWFPLEIHMQLHLQTPSFQVSSNFKVLDGHAF